MILRRSLLVGAAVALLAACETPAPPATDGPAFVARQIVVDTTQITGVVGREIVVSPTQIQSDLQTALRENLQRDGTPNVDVSVTIQKVELVSRGASVAFLQSNIKAILHVRDVASGTDVIPPTEMVGFSEQVRLGGVVGVLSAPTAEQDYRQTIRGFSAAVRDRIYGVPEAT